MASQSSGGEDVIVVTCGSLQGLLHKKAFLCPGLHQECIEVNGHMTTPKMFSVMGDKERLKDWKNAVRIKGVSLRKLMESGEIDFYNHQESCTGRCLSRVSKYDIKMDSLHGSDGELAMGANPTMPQVPNPEPVYHHYQHCNYALLQNPEQKLPGRDMTQDVFTHYSASAAPTNMLFGTMASSSAGEGVMQKPHTFIPFAIKSEPEAPPEENEAACGASGQTAPSGNHGNSVTVVDNIPLVAVDTHAKSNKHHFNDAINIGEDSEVFWRGIINVGLLDAFVREIKMGVDSVKHCLVKFPNSRVNENSKKLSNIVNELGLMAKLKYRLAEHRQQTEKMDVQLLHEIEALKRRVIESEHKRNVLRRKSECFDQLRELSQPAKICKSTHRTEKNSSTTRDIPSTVTRDVENEDS